MYARTFGRIFASRRVHIGIEFGGFGFGVPVRGFSAQLFVFVFESSPDGPMYEPGLEGAQSPGAVSR